jgi:hypothetical protein
VVPQQRLQRSAKRRFADPVAQARKLGKSRGGQGFFLLRRPFFEERALWLHPYGD